jgi:hypothetical protein
MFANTRLCCSIVGFEVGEGQVATVNYAKGLLLMTPPWIIYVLCLIFLLPRWGFVKSLIAGVLTYMILAGVVSIVMKHLGRG